MARLLDKNIMTVQCEVVWLVFTNHFSTGRFCGVKSTISTYLPIQRSTTVVICDTLLTSSDIYHHLFQTANIDTVNKVEIKIAMSNLILNIARITVSTASLSFVASTVMAIAIVRSDGWLSSPYQRIIFGLCLSDILQSLCLIVGPFAVPSMVPQGIWAVGNYQTCQANGFLFNFGSLSTPMYMFALCIYTALKIKKNMSDEMFSQKIEKLVHIIIVLFSVTVCVAGLATKSINSAVVGTYCTYAAVPTGCRQYPDMVGECDPAIAKSAVILAFINTIGVPFSCLFGIICLMVGVYWHVLQATKQPLSANPLRRSGGEGRTTSHLRSSNESAAAFLKNTGADMPRASPSFLSSISESVFDSMDGGESYINLKNHQSTNTVVERDLEQEPTEPGTKLLLETTQEPTEPRTKLHLETVHEPTEQGTKLQLETVAQEPAEPGTLLKLETEPNQIRSSLERPILRDEGLIKVYRRLIMIQALLFVLVYIVTFFFFWVAYLTLLVGKVPRDMILYLVAFFYPLGGFLNIIVYTRPKVSYYRIKHPECNWFHVFWIVVKVGGADPKTHVNSVADGNGINSDPLVSSSNRLAPSQIRLESMQSSGGFMNIDMSSQQSFGEDIDANEIEMGHVVGGSSYLKGILVEDGEEEDRIKQ